MTWQVRGEIHHDRRLHQLMLAEEQKGWDRSRGLSTLPALPADDEQTLGLDEPLLSFSSSLGSSAHIAQVGACGLLRGNALPRWAHTCAICTGLAGRGLVHACGRAPGTWLSSLLPTATHCRLVQSD